MTASVYPSSLASNLRGIAADFADLAATAERTNDDAAVGVKAESLLALVAAHLRTQIGGQDTADEVVVMADLHDDLLSDYDRRVSAAAENGGIVGARCGLDHLDEIINGWQSGVYILGALSSTGKTTLCLQWASHIAQTGKHALYISLENSALDLRTKTACRFGHLSYADAKKGRIPRAEWARANDLVDDRLGRRLTTYCPRGMLRPLPEIAQEATEKMGAPPALIVVDYLQEMASRISGSPVDDERQMLNNFIPSMRQVAERYGCAVLAISSLNRASNGAAGKGNRGSDLSSFMGTAKIEYGSDVAMLLTRAEENETMAARTIYGSTIRRMELHIVKNREGMTGRPIPLEMWGDQCLFQEEDR